MTKLSGLIILASIVKIKEPAEHLNSLKDRENAATLRGHMLLCLQGFRGEGYSPGFVDNMAAIHKRLKSNPETRVQLSDTPDHICQACPNLNGGCTLRGPDFEQHIVFQDRQVLDLLGLKVGQEVAWAEVLNRIGSRMKGEMLKGICGDCQWLSLGYCQEGIEQLREFVNRTK